MNQCNPHPDPPPRSLEDREGRSLCRTAAGLAGLVSGLCSSVSSAPWISLLFNGTTSPLIPACHSTAFTARALPCTSPQHNRLLSVLTHLSASLAFPLSSIQFIQFKFYFNVLQLLHIWTETYATKAMYHQMKWYYKQQAIKQKKSTMKLTNRFNNQF